MNRIYIMTVSNNSLEPRINKGDIIHCGITNEYKGEGLYLIPKGEDNYEVVRIMQNSTGDILIAQDNNKYVKESTSQQQFKELCFAKVLWVSKCIDLSMPEAEPYIQDALYGIDLYSSINNDLVGSS